jgi:hypothetical protein
MNIFTTLRDWYERVTMDATARDILNKVAAIVTGGARYL